MPTSTVNFKTLHSASSFFRSAVSLLAMIPVRSCVRVMNQGMRIRGKVRGHFQHEPAPEIIRVQEWMIYATIRAKLACKF
jgi:hypothetical protein